MVKYTRLSEQEIKVRYANMYYRCYSKAFQKSHPWYEGCTICDEWLNPEHGLERFTKWCNENYYVIDGEGTTQLDKDILVNGNKVYGPDTCIFVTKRINCMFSGSSRKNENGLPMGVQYNARRQQYYPVLTGLDGRNIIDKEYYDTAEEAWQRYVQHKQDYLESVAEAYRSVIPEKVYKAIRNHEFTIDG